MRLLVLTLLCFWALDASAGCWKPVAQPNSVTFNASQAGAPFPGEFKSYTALLCLDDKNPAASKLEVQVDMGSVSTGSPDMDEALKGEDFFDVAHAPKASFASDAVKQISPGHYQVDGKLTLRGATHPVSVPFTFTPSADGKSAKLAARYTLKRLDYGIGQGEWKDTSWVADPVDLNFSITLAPASP